jgi:hypothetical protein
MLIFDLKVSRLIFQIDLRLIVEHLPIFPCFEKMLQKKIPPDIAPAAG